MARLKRLDELELMVLFVLTAGRICQWSKVGQSSGEPWWLSSIVPKNELPPLFDVRFRSMMAYSKPLDVLVPMLSSVWYAGDICRGPKSFSSFAAKRWQSFNSSNQQRDFDLWPWLSHWQWIDLMLTLRIDWDFLFCLWKAWFDWLIW